MGGVSSPRTGTTNWVDSNRQHASIRSMPKEQEVLRFGDREVVVTNPGKVFFEAIGATKLDLVNFYVAVAPGTLTGAGGRPMALKRFVNGAAGEAFFQKRAPSNLPDFLRTVELSFPSG